MVSHMGLLHQGDSSYNKHTEERYRRDIGEREEIREKRLGRREIYNLYRGRERIDIEERDNRYRGER